MQLVFFFNSSLRFGKIKILKLFKTFFPIIVSQKLSTYSNHECIQLKNTKFAINALEISAKKLSNLLKVTKGEVTFKALLRLIASNSNRKS